MTQILFMKQPTCFVIDDDQDDREIFMMALENANGSYACVTAKNGIDAINIIKSDTDFRPDFVFLDLNMPYMSGKECLEHIKKFNSMSDVPVIIYTTSSYSKDIEDTQKLGASHFLVKPPGIGALTKVLSQLLTGASLPYYINFDESP